MNQPLPMDQTFQEIRQLPMEVSLEDVARWLTENPSATHSGAKRVIKKEWGNWIFPIGISALILLFLAYWQVKPESPAVLSIVHEEAADSPVSDKPNFSEENISGRYGLSDSISIRNFEKFLPSEKISPISQIKSPVELWSGEIILKKKVREIPVKTPFPRKKLSPGTTTLTSTKEYLKNKPLTPQKSPAALALVADSNEKDHNILYEDGRSWEGEGLPLNTMPFSPFGWRKDGCCVDKIVMKADMMTYHSGHRSALITVNEPGFQGEGRWVQSFSAKAFSGKRIRLGVYLRILNIENEAGILIRALNKNETKSFLSHEQELIGPEEGRWRLHVIEVDIPARAKRIEIGAYLKGNGSIWIDDFRIEAMGADGPITAEKLNRGGSVNSVPVNLGFERDD